MRLPLPDKVDGMFDEIWLDRPLDGLVNNAAGNFIVGIETLLPRAFDSIINIVLHGSAYCTMAAGKRWIEDKHRGTILSILATSTWPGRAFMVPSATAKAGVLSMMRSLATESGPRGNPHCHGRTGNLSNPGPRRGSTRTRPNATRRLRASL